MVIQDNVIRLTDYEYSPRLYGSNIGVPTVSLKLSSSESNGQKVSAFEPRMQNYGWKRRLKSGFARLRFYGSDPLNEMHMESYEAIDRMISPRFVDFTLGERWISRVPPRRIQNMADSFEIFVPLDGSYDDDAMEYFVERSSNYGDVSFVFKVKSTDESSDIRKFSNEHNIYDSDIWLMPAGRKINKVSQRMEYCQKMAKSNSWNLSPRMDVVLDYEEEE